MFIPTTAKNINRSHHAVSNCNLGCKTSPDRPKIQTSLKKIIVLQKLSNATTSIRQAPSFQVSKYAEHRFIKTLSHLKHKGIKGYPKFAIAHIRRRLDWAQYHISWTLKWNTITGRIK